MIILSTLRYGEEAYGSASQAIRALVICRTENILWETILPTLAEMWELKNVKTTIRIITNPRLPHSTFLRRTEENGQKCIQTYNT
jgi:hypothetical protein